MSAKSSAGFQCTNPACWSPINDLHTYATAAPMCCETTSHPTPYRFLLRSPGIYLYIKGLSSDHQSLLIMSRQIAKSPASRGLLKKQKNAGHMKKECPIFTSLLLSYQPGSSRVASLVVCSSTAADISCG